jgi:hypothetical protein
MALPFPIPEVVLAGDTCWSSMVSDGPRAPSRMFDPMVLPTSRRTLLDPRGRHPGSVAGC